MYPTTLTSASSLATGWTPSLSLPPKGKLQNLRARPLCRPLCCLSPSAPQRDLAPGHPTQKSSSSQQKIEEEKKEAIGEQDARYSGRVLGPPARGGYFDDLCRGGPVVVRVREGGGGSSFRMYYYGRSLPTWNFGVRPFFPTFAVGDIGMATSLDGVSWQRFQGPLSRGAVMKPRDDPEAFDSVHLACSDVAVGGWPPGSNDLGSQWALFYSAGSLKEAEVPGVPGLRLKGAQIQSGVATSPDGVSFTHAAAPILPLGAPGEVDFHGIAWPRLLAPEGGGGEGGGGERRWLLTYHSRVARKDARTGENGPAVFVASAATSVDGRVWEKHGPILEAGEGGAWDEAGVSVRHVVRLGSTLVMLYEGSDFSGKFSIGLATSRDGLQWEKDTRAGPQPGGPVLTARKGEDFWDNEIVGSPYVVITPGGALWMYYYGVGRLEGEERAQQGFGLAVSHVSEFWNWERHPHCG